MDTKLKEYTTGASHDVTDRVYVIRRAFRINDGLPSDPPNQPHWIWQRGGWLMVDRISGHITSIKLPDFDAFYSAAYCGIPDGKAQLLALVAQIGTRKPLFRKELAKSGAGDLPSADCAAPQWERHPARVTFLPANGNKFTVNIKTRQVDEPVDTSEDE